jgi:hypothetical protein
MRSRTGRLARLARGRRLDRNPLRRGSDRVETVVSGALLAGFLAAALFAAHAAGSWAYATSAREAQAQQATIRQVPAILMQAPSPTAAFPGAGVVSLSAGARWRAPDGRERTGELVVPSGAGAGGAVPVWVDQAGQLADPPLSRVQLTARAQLARELAAGALGIALAAANWLTRWLLNRRRMAAWDADWLATGPRWSRQR